MAEEELLKMGTGEFWSLALEECKFKALPADSTDAIGHESECVVMRQKQDSDLMDLRFKALAYRGAVTKTTTRWQSAARRAPRSPSAGLATYLIQTHQDTLWKKIKKDYSAREI